MKIRNTRAYYGLLFFITVSFLILSVIAASYIESDFGKVQVSQIRIPIRTIEGIDTYIPGKIYVPKSVNTNNPAPAVLALHGYQNDKDTSAAYALELARRGIVALTIDQFGHGTNPLGMRHRGYDISIWGPNRFKMFMSFSDLDRDKTEGLIDPSMGASACFRWLQSQDYIVDSKVGFTGHSMGTWSSIAVAQNNPVHAAIVLQCGQPYGPVQDEQGQVVYKNVLMLQARYDEFDYFRDYAHTTAQLNETILRYNTFAGQDAPIQWNKTYGNFKDGSARRMEMIETVHRGVTHSGHAISTAMEWFTSAFDLEAQIEADDLVYLYRELLLGLALLIGILSLLPLGSLLMTLPYFNAIAKTMPERYVMPKKSWWKHGIMGICLSAVLYPFMTQLGHGLFPYPDGIYKTLMAGGLILWLDTLAIIAFFMFRHWYKKGEGKQLGVTMYDMGYSFEKDRTVLNWSILGKTVLIALIMFIYLLITVSIIYSIFNNDLRFIWPFLRPLTFGRFVQFLLYLPFFFIFFLFNGGIKLFGQMRLAEASSATKTHWLWWAKSVVLMLGGLVLVALFEYVPFFMGYGTGFALTGLSLFDGPFMSALVLIFPQFFVLFFVAVYFFRKTGKVFLGSIIVSIIVTWITCGGAAYF